MSERQAIVRGLYRERPRSRMVRASMLLLAALAAYAWYGGDFHAEDMFSARRAENAQRFLGEIRPYPLQGRPFDLSVAADWVRDRAAAGGLEAAAATLAISVAAIVLATLLAALSCLVAARNVVSPEAFLPSPRAPSFLTRALASATVAATRTLFMFTRAVPEYVWAFLLVTSLGFTAWPAVLALAIHNLGILGKLMAETVEDIDPARAAALRGLGAGRGQIALVAIAPDVLPRFLLYFFYRWETCVREATVLGMLGVLSLGSLIRDARAAGFYDEMVFFVLIGAALVLAGDVTSALARASLRRAS